MKYIILLIINIFLQGQCFGGVETYEKTSGTTVLCTSDCTSQVQSSTYIPGYSHLCYGALCPELGHFSVPKVFTS